MDRGARYTVKTRYGVFSLDEGSYQDYLAGKLWINWPPKQTTHQPTPQELLPNVSAEAVQLRDDALKHGTLAVLQRFAMSPNAPYKERMHDVAIYELNLSVRASNGLMRAGVHSFSKLNKLIESDAGIGSVRNLGAKSVKEISSAFIAECYDRLLPHEKARFWQEVLDLNKEVIA